MLMVGGSFLEGGRNGGSYVRGGEGGGYVGDSRGGGGWRMNADADLSSKFPLLCSCTREIETTTAPRLHHIIKCQHCHPKI